jgi:catechol 2,3-dioxygenase-like lactoylglutathione lyase family enzyme
MDERPKVALGHIRLHCGDLEASRQFYCSLGMRQCLSFPGVHVLELRGGTHLLLIQSPDGMMEHLDAPIDLIVDDLQGFRVELKLLGYLPTDISFHPVIGHHRFTVSDPDGRRVVIQSTHTEGRLV